MMPKTVTVEKFYKVHTTHDLISKLCTTLNMIYFFALILLLIGMTVVENVPMKIITALVASMVVTKMKQQCFMLLTKLSNYDLYFIHIPKNGGTSFSKQFLGHHIKHKSITCYPKNIWHKTIAIIRNPFTRLVSTYNFIKAGDGYWFSSDKSDVHYLYEHCNKITFKQFVKEINTNANIYNDVLILPQYIWIITPQGNIVSNIVKLENIDNDLSKLLNTDMEMIKINNSKNVVDYREYYDDITEELVRKIYKKDFELFGPFDIPK